MKEYIEFNLNQYVWVRLNDRGREFHKKSEDELMGELPSYKYSPPDENDKGWSKWQLWELMQAFGGAIYHGCNPPFETTILIERPEQEK